MVTVKVTKREYEIASIIFEYGWSNQRVADHLCVTNRAVESHLYSLYKKIGVKGDRSLMVWMRYNTLEPVKEHPRTRLSSVLKKRIYAMLDQCITPSAIAERLNIAPETVYRHKKQWAKQKEESN